MSTTNGGPAPAPNQLPQINVVAQYIKDFSFENPNAPQSLRRPATQPQISIQINVAAKPLANNDFEVTLKLDGKADINTNCCSASSWNSPACSASRTFRRKA